MNPKKFPKLIVTETWQGYATEDIRKCLDEAMYQRWCTWFSGQTGAITSDGKFCVYDYDFHRFLEQQGILVGSVVPNYNKKLV